MTDQQQPQMQETPFDMGNPFIGMVLPHRLWAIVTGQYAMITLRVGSAGVTAHMKAQEVDDVIAALQHVRRNMATGGLIVPAPGTVLPAPPNGQRGRG